MLIAIATEGKQVAEHFGRCPLYTFARITDGKLVDKYQEMNPGHAPGVIPRFLHEKGAGYIVCGGMGHRAKTLFDEMGIITVMGISGDIDDVIDSFAKGEIQSGESFCAPGKGRGYGIDKAECDHE